MKYIITKGRGGGVGNSHRNREVCKFSQFTPFDLWNVIRLPIFKSCGEEEVIQFKDLREMHRWLLEISSNFGMLFKHLNWKMFKLSALFIMWLPWNPTLPITSLDLSTRLDSSHCYQALHISFLRKRKIFKGRLYQTTWQSSSHL